jgi:hypothetical protein
MKSTFFSKISTVCRVNLRRDPITFLSQPRHICSDTNPVTRQIISLEEELPPAELEMTWTGVADLYPTSPVFGIATTKTGANL